MTIQYSTTHRNNNMADITTQLATTAFLLIYTGAPPANPGSAATGTLLVSIPCSNPFAAAPAGGVLTASAFTATNAVANGTAGYWRLCTSSAGTTCVAQGTVQPQVVISTSALTAANGNVLTFAATTGVVTGMTVSGAGVPTGSTVVATTGTTVTISQTSTAGVANATSITFGGDITFAAGVAFTIGMSINVSSFTDTATGA